MSLISAGSISLDSTFNSHLSNPPSAVWRKDTKMLISFHYTTADDFSLLLEKFACLRGCIPARFFQVLSEHSQSFHSMNLRKPPSSYERLMYVHSTVPAENEQLIETNMIVSLIKFMDQNMNFKLFCLLLHTIASQMIKPFLFLHFTASVPPRVSF